MSDIEIKAITAVNEALASIDDPEIRNRVLRWVNDKFGFVPSGVKPTRETTRQRGLPSMSEVVAGEIDGIAMLTETGEFRLTVRDLKAKSANDAALRLAHIAIRAYQKLTGQKTVSSKNFLVPLLKDWRVYDGNTRAALARHKGIIRNGDELGLDSHATTDAERFISDALDNAIDGTWKPSTKARKRSASPEKMAV